MEPHPFNTRYILEQERNRLIWQQREFDARYGVYVEAVQATVENLALVAYLYIAAVLLRKSRTKTNLMVTVWALINAAVLGEKLVRFLGKFLQCDMRLGEDLARLAEMAAALARTYGTCLAVEWLFSKYSDASRAKYNFLVYLLMVVPALVHVYFIFYYFYVNRYIYEVYGPGSDIVDLAVYMLVGLGFVVCRIFGNSGNDTSSYALLVSLVNLVTSFPICLMTIYLRFNLDISWSYRFHIYLVDFFINVISCSSAFIVLTLVVWYVNYRKIGSVEKKLELDEDEEEDTCC